MTHSLKLQLNTVKFWTSYDRGFLWELLKLWQLALCSLHRCACLQQSRASALPRSVLIRNSAFPQYLDLVGKRLPFILSSTLMINSVANFALLQMVQRINTGQDLAEARRACLSQDCSGSQSTSHCATRHTRASSTSVSTTSLSFISVLNIPIQIPGSSTSWSPGLSHIRMRSFNAQVFWTSSSQCSGYSNSFHVYAVSWVWNLRIAVSSND